jgi:hypothetical protein
MALRSLYAIDIQSLIVSSSSDPSLVGEPATNYGGTPDGTVLTFGGGSMKEVVLDDVLARGRSKINDDLPDLHKVTDGNGLVEEGTGIEAESILVVRALNDLGQPVGPEIEIYLFSQGGVEDDIWGFGSNAPLDPGTSYVKIGGDDDGTVKYKDFITCFTAGTRIKTARGNIPVEDLCLGQTVWTRDAGHQPIRWIGSTEVTGSGPMAPVRIEAGALGNGRDLLVSQQHRIWIESAAAELHFGQPSVLVAAKHLCGLPGIALAPCPTVHYVHFMFDKHQIVRSNGILSESFFLADHGLSALDAGPRAELIALFPHLKDGMAAFGTTAAPTLTAREARVLKRYFAA